LTKEQVWEHAKTFKDQVFKILDEDKTELRSNGEWFDSMSFADCLDLAYRTTVARMLERNDFEKRYREGNPISITEFLYPLMQGYDSVALKCDSNSAYGPKIQPPGRQTCRSHGQLPQIVLMTPLIEGLDGSKKMSKTERNYIAVDDSPEDMFGKTMSVQDSLVIKYFMLLTDVDEAEVRRFERALKDVEKHQDLADPLHPMQVKKALARSIVAEYHNAAAAAKAEEHFEKVVQRKTPDEVPLRCFKEKSAVAHELVVNLMSVSGSEARRLVGQGGVKIDGVKISDPAQQIVLGPREQMVQVGKRRFFRIKLGDE
jgi:tyrosyl-tRNA synthetase